MDLRPPIPDPTLTCADCRAMPSPGCPNHACRTYRLDAALGRWILVYCGPHVYGAVAVN